jgi:hypothetical protein
MIKKKLTAYVHSSLAPGRSGGVETELIYDGGRDPLAVQLCFKDGSYDVIWNVSRDLLLEGVDSFQLAGRGDILVRSGYHEVGSVVYVHLSSPEGTAILRFSRDALKKFLAKTVAAVPTGGEGIVEHLDTFLAGLPSTVEEFDAQMREAEDRAREEESE